MREGRAAYRKQGGAAVVCEGVHKGLAIDDERVPSLAAVARHVPQRVTQLLAHCCCRQRVRLLVAALILQRIHLSHGCRDGHLVTSYIFSATELPNQRINQHSSQTEGAHQELLGEKDMC